PAEALSTLKGGVPFCTACQTRNPIPAAFLAPPEPQRLVCGTGEATMYPAAIKLANVAGDNGWTTSLGMVGGAITLTLDRGDDHGSVLWTRNDEGAWRFTSCKIAGER